MGGDGREIIPVEETKVDGRTDGRTRLSAQMNDKKLGRGKENSNALNRSSWAWESRKKRRRRRRRRKKREGKGD
jgi:hypothetical protein